MYIRRTESRVLVKDTEISIDDGSVIQYTGIYYKRIDDVVDYVEIELSFIGTVVSARTGTYDAIGIYVLPAFLFNQKQNAWNRIVNLPQNPDKPVYPHLLMMPVENRTYSQEYRPLYLLHTVQAAEFPQCTESIDFSLSGV